jgi:rsbT co-antagonist protein RsbR
MHEVAEGLLRRIERDGARAALIDVTGAPVIDTVAAQAIVRLVEAARMLGCEVMLVGIMPEVAQTLVALGVDLAGLRTAVDLQTGIALLASRQSLERRSLQAAARTLR